MKFRDAGPSATAVAAVSPFKAPPCLTSIDDKSQEKNRDQEHDHHDLHEIRSARLALAFWKEIDDKTFGKGFDCFVEDATCNLGVAEWKGRETIRENLRAFIDTGFTALHDVVEYWDGGQLKVFRGIVTMTPDDKDRPAV